MASVWGGDSPSVAWGYNSWESNTVTQSLTAPTAITASLGDLAYAQSEEGWGRDTWGSNQWGEDTIDVTLSGLSITSHLGPDGWGINSFGNGRWGGEFTFKPESIIVPSGVSFSSSIGTPTYAFDMIFGITGLDAIGSGLGTLSINNGADHSQGLASFAVTASVGSLDHTMTYEISGVSTTGSVGSVTVSSVELIDITGVYTTASVGSISPTEMSMGLTGVSTTSNV